MNWVKKVEQKKRHEKHFCAVFGPARDDARQFDADSGFAGDRKKIKHFFVSGVVDHHGLFNCGDCMHPDYRLYVGPVRKKKDHAPMPSDCGSWRSVSRFGFNFFQ